jgi:hypothetical protein
MGLTEQGLFTKGQLEKATANRYLPLINGILHVLFASLVPVLVIFMLTPLMLGAIMLAFTFGLWMIVWKFAEAVVNGFFYSKLVGNFYNFAQQQGWDFNVLYAPVISSLLVDHISLGGSLYWLVPTVSFMIASLGGYAFHSFAAGLGGAVQGTAQASAGDVARGNFNAGQVNYRNVSAGNTSLGNFSGWGTNFFTTSGLQENVGNITRRGSYMQMFGGRIGDVSGVALQARANGDRAGFMAYQFARLALGNNAKMISFEADARGGILGFTALGEDGTSISYRPGEGGTGVLTLTMNGKTITTKVNSDGSIEGITTGDMSRHLQAMFGESLVQSWAQELARAQKDTELLSQLIQEANRITEVDELERFYRKVKEAQGQKRTELVQEALQRIANLIETFLEKSKTLTKKDESTTKEENTIQNKEEVGGRVGANVEAKAEIERGKPTGERQGDPGKNGANVKVKGGGGVGFSLNLEKHASHTNTVTSSNTNSVISEQKHQTGTRKRDSQENVRTEAQRETHALTLSNTTSQGTSHSVKHGSVQEFMKTVSQTLQSAKENLESYRQSLQSANSVEFRKALLPVVFNQLKQEEAQKLQNSGLSKEEIEAKAAMNALARLDDMIEKNPRELFKYLNSVSGLPDAGDLKKKVEENTPKGGEVGKPPPALQQEYSLNAFVGNKRQADALAKKLTQLTGRQAEVIKTDKGYMVSVGGFHSEGIARVVAQGLRLKNYQVAKVEPQQRQQPQQQQPPAPAK